jgi:hypothetical protein
MKKPKATKKAVENDKDEEITNPFYGMSMEDAIDKIVKAGKPKSKKKKEGK